MAGMSTYLENQLLNWLRGFAFSAAPTLYVGLFNGDPTDAGTGGAEVTTTVRAAGRPAAGAFGAPAGKMISNSAVIDYGNAAGAATFSHFGIFDAQAGGNLLISNTLNAGSQTVAAGSAVKFPAGSLVLAAE